MPLGKTTSTNNRQGLTALSTITGKQESITSTGGILNSGATLSGSAIPASGLSTAAAVQIVDGSGNQITSFGGGTQYIDGGTPPAHPIGPTLIYDNAGAWQHVSAASPLPVTNSNFSTIATNTGNSATSANQTNGNQQTKITDGTNTTNVVANNSTSAGNAGNFLPMGSTGYTTNTVTLTSAASSSPWYDLLNYPSLAIGILANSSGSNLAFQTANDASFTNIVSMSMTSSSSTVGVPSTSTSSSTATYFGNRMGRYFRVTGTLTGGNTISLSLTFFTNPTSPNVFGVSAGQNGTWTVQPGNTPNATPWIFSQAIHNSGVAVSSSVTVVKNAPGYLSGVLVTTAGTSQSMTIYDNASAASGTVIGVVPSGATAGQYYPFNMPAANGITCSGSSNNPAVTVAYS